MFAENVEEYLNFDLFEEPVDFERGIFLSINKCLDFKLYANIDDRKDVVCLGYVYKADGIYLFSYHKDYLLIKISTIESFTCTDTPYRGQFIHYKSYKNRI